MEIILLLFVLEYILCFRKEYYTKCAYDSEYIINPSTKKCNYYNPSDGYCCYLTYQEYSDEPLDGGGEITKGDNEDKIKNDSKKLRKLLDIDSDCCIGISRIGYNHIDKVIKEIEKETDYYKVFIDCNQNRLKLTLLNNFISFFIIINIIINF